MTLKEFSAEFLPLPDATFKFGGGEVPVWRKVFPTNLRFHTKPVKQMTIKRVGLLRLPVASYETVPTRVLEEQWERVHKGEIIDREWREVYDYGETH